MEVDDGRAATRAEAAGAEPAAQNLAKAFHMTVERLGDGTALRWGEDETMSWNELRAQRRGRGRRPLQSSASEPGDTVAIMLNNRAEFFAIDLGVSTLGGVPFSIYQTASPEQIAYVVGDAGAKVAFVETAFLGRLREGARRPARARAPDRRSTATAATMTLRGAAREATPTSTTPRPPTPSASTTRSR